MKRSLIVGVTLVLAVTVVVTADRSQIQLPRPPAGLPTSVPNLRLPSLADLTGASPLTTTIDDAVTEVAFLDRFNPQTAAPLLELPFGMEDGLTLVPGLWEGELQSYCLLAGTYGPSRGDGYLWAPWKGPKADVVTTILNKSARHPEIAQQDIQVLLWGLLARTRVSTLPEGAKAAAESLLTRAQMSSIDGSALDVIPGDWLVRITDRVAEPVRRVVEAENRMREIFANPGGAAYDELEEIAVLHGAPPMPAQGRQVPGGRWSYVPSGVFVRYLPKSYADIVLQLYVPEPFTSTRDAGGRLTSVRDQDRTLMQLEYTGAAISRATLTSDGGAARSLTLTPAGDAANAAARDAVSSAARLVPSGKRGAPRSQDVADLSLIAARVPDPEASAFLSRAWASAVADWARGDGGTSAHAFGRFHYSQASFGGLLSRPGGGQALSALGAWGGAAYNFFFSDGGGGGVPQGGLQRGGTSLRGPNAADRARRVVNAGNSLIGKGVWGPMFSTTFGFAIPAAMVGGILDRNFDAYAKVHDQLKFDPPRADFTQFTKPDVPTTPRVDAGAGLTASQADHLNTFARDLMTTVAYLRAGIVAMDRHGGAVQAGDRVWASRQAQALIFLKRGAGELALKVADDLDALAVDAKDLPPITSETYEAERRKLAAGWNDADRQAATAAGLSAADLETIRTARLAQEPGDPMPAAEMLRLMASVLREDGALFAALPRVPAPWAASSSAVAHVHH